MSVSAAFKTICASLGALAGYFFGELDGFFYAVVTMVVIDYITGVMCAVVRKQLSSEIGFRGIFKKIFIFIFIGMAHIIDVHILNEVGVLRTVVIFFYLSNESISVIENAAMLGLPVPDRLIDVLHQLRNSSSNKKK